MMETRIRSSFLTCSRETCGRVFGKSRPMSRSQGDCAPP
jgi:hypothetical protein